MESRDYVTLMYQALLGRPPDDEGLGIYTRLLDDTGDLRRVVDAFVGSDEYRDRNQPPRVASDDPPMACPGRPLVIVDVGAQKLADEDHVYAPLLTCGCDWRCIGFEPIAERRAERMALEPDPRLTLLEAFIGDGERHRFHVVNDDGSSSLLRLNSAFIAAYEHISTLEIIGEEEVQTHRLDDVLAGEPAIDFLKFDIQGFEFRSLTHASAVLARTNVVHCECFFGDMYEAQGYFADIDALLRRAGFDFIDFPYVARYRYVAVPRPSQRGERAIWADAVYFRRLSQDVDEVAHFHAQALIAAKVYGKPGLAQHILSGLDGGKS